MRLGQVEQILNTNFIFSPYTNAQSLIRAGLLNNFPLNNLRRDSQLYDKAIAYAEDQLRHGGTNLYEYVYLAIAYSKKGDFLNDKNFYDKAEEYFKKAINLSPKRQEMYYAYGQFLADQGRYNESLSTFKKALDLGEQAIFSQLYYGLVLAASGDQSYGESLGHLEYFFNSPGRYTYQTDPFNPDLGWQRSKEVYNLFLRYYYEQKDVNRVLIVAKRLSELDEAQGASFRQIVDIINKTGQIPNIEFKN